MQLNLWRSARGLILAVMLLGASFAVHMQPARAQSEEEQAAADAALDAEIQRAHHGFDLLARTFTKKKRSELINLKSYTDAEWAELERAVKTNDAACRKGDSEACLAAGTAYETGDGVWIVSDIAFILYNDACNLGLGEGCRAFYDLANSGFGYPDDSYEATDRYLEKSCDRGNLFSCIDYADTLRGGSPQDQARAETILQSTCKAGELNACAALGDFLLRSGKPDETERGTQILESACRQTGVQACRTLARQLEHGGTPDPVQINLYKHYACYGGSADECAEMGTRAYRGIGATADRDLAVRYFAESCRIEPLNCRIAQTLAAIPKLRAACDTNDANACADLGLALTEYGSPEADSDQAAQLLEASCRRGFNKACYPAVKILQSAPATADRARELLETGCTSGDPQSCFRLALTFDDTPGSPDLDRAVAIYSQLCDAKDAEACELELRNVGLSPNARIRPAGENFVPPLLSDTPTDIMQPSEIMEVCFNGSERFRGKTYTQFNCDRSEKGINSERARPGQAPWQALLWRPDTMFDTKLSPAQRVKCGGSLIAQSWVLTAAHCLNDEGFDLADPKVRSGYRIRLGVYDPGTAEGISYPILRVIRHPQFDLKNKLAFDVALIQYDTRAPQAEAARAYKNPIHTIALDAQPVGARKITAGMVAYAFGWGWTAEQKSTTTDYLQIMKLDVSTEAACTAVTGFTKALSNAALCAKGKAGTQTCYGDSGGPLVYYGDRAGRPVLIGVVSAGAKCGTTIENRPSQYTRVAKVRDWIAAYVPGIK